MVKTKLKIIKHENKTGKGGRDYTRFQTSNGWMSAFDDELIEDLKAAEGRIVSVEVAESDKGFFNIRKFYGIDATAKELDDEIESCDKLIDAIDPKKGNSDKTVPVKDKSIYTPTSIYVSYAKDIFCAMFKEGNAEETMQRCIALVKQAHKAFE